MEGGSFLGEEVRHEEILVLVMVLSWGGREKWGKNLEAVLLVLRNDGLGLSY